MKFIETDVCKSRQNCIACRRDARFRDHFEKQHEGAWECPMGIAIDAPDEKFPPEVITRWKEAQKQAEEHHKKMEAARVAMDELSMVLSGDNLTRLDLIRALVFPQTKVAAKCINSTKKIGEVDQVCCGGTVKKVDAFDCSKHGLCTDKKCNACSDYASKK